MVEPVVASSVAGGSDTPLAAQNAGRGLFALTSLSLVLTALTLLGVVQRVLYPYDLTAWADDYVLHELVKYRLGAPLYGSYDAASSFTLPPGVVLFHHALLSPFGLDLSLVANRLLAQLWLLLSVVLGVRLVSRLSAGRFRRRRDSVLAVLGAAAALTLAGYSNSLADSLHPAALELLLLTLAATFAADWPRLPRSARFAVVLVLPACALLVTQSGAAVALSLATVALTTAPVPGRERVACALLSVLSAAIAFAAILVATDWAFWNWGVVLPWRRPFMPHHVAYAVTFAAAIAPLLLLIANGAHAALRDRDCEPHAAWLRVAVGPAAYWAVAMPAFLRVGGGAFELGAVVFLCATLGMAQVKTALCGSAHSLPRAGVAMLAALQLLLWSPYRDVPSAAERAWAQNVCAHVQEAIACGEHVLVDLGSACLSKAPLRDLPRDRLASLMGLTWAGLGQAPGTRDRLAREEYDMLAIHFLPVPWPWGPAALGALAQHYVAFATLPAVRPPPNTNFDLNDRPHFDDWQGIDFGVVLFERTRESGRHRALLAGPVRCAHTP